MTVYVELVILQNFLVNSFLLFFSAKLFRLKFGKFRLILAGLSGVGFAFLFTVTQLHLMVDIVLRALCGLFCVLVLLKSRNWREIGKCYATFLVLTFCFGGAVYALLNAFKIEGSSNVYNFVFAASLALLMPFGWVCFRFVKKINLHKKVSAFCYDVKIKVGEKTVSTRGFYDSGNRLVDKESGKPINIISLSLASKLNMDCVQNGRYIEFSTIGEERQKIFVFEAEELSIKKEREVLNIKDALCAVMRKNFKDHVAYEMLFNSEVL